MNQNEVYKLLYDGNLTIAFDTNVVRQIRRFLSLCDSINRINDARHCLMRLVVSAIVHTETLFDLKQKYQEQYDINDINRVLNRKHISIVPFEPHHAQAVAQLIGKQFPSNDEWYTFKRQDCINCLGINQANIPIPGSGKKCGATVDWLIAGYAYAEECLLVTDDKGKEFDGINKKTTLKVIEAAVNEFLQVI